MSVESFEIIKTEQMEEQENGSLVTATEKLEEIEVKLEKIRQLSTLVTSVNFQQILYKARTKWITFRLLNVVCGKDITKQGSLKFGHVRKTNGRGVKLIKMKLERKNGFVQPDGSVQLEVDFTIETATIDHYFVEAKCKEDAKENIDSKKDGN